MCYRPIYYTDRNHTSTQLEAGLLEQQPLLVLINKRRHESQYSCTGAPVPCAEELKLLRQASAPS